MLKDKRAEGNWIVSDEIFWIVFTVVLGFAAIIYAIILLSVGDDTSKIRADTENYFLVEKFLKSSDCFASYDIDIKKTYSGVLDYEKFTDAQLNSCMNGLEEKSAFKLNLKSPDQIIPPLTVKTNNWNENRPSREGYTKKLQIFYKNDYYNGEMSIEIQNIK